MIINWGPWVWDFADPVELPFTEHGSIKWGDGAVEHWVKDANNHYLRQCNDGVFRRTSTTKLSQRIYEAASELVEGMGDEDCSY